VPHGLIVFGESGEVLAANRLTEVLFAYGPGELMGQRIERLLPEASHDAHPDLWTSCTDPERRMFGAGQPVAGVRSDGTTVPLEIGLKLLVDGQTRYLIASVADATERLRLEASVGAASSRPLGVRLMLADLAERFATIEPDAIDDALVDSLGRIAKALQLDRAVLLWKAADDASAVASHCWNGHPQPSLLDRSQLASIPFIASKLNAGEASWFTRVDELPDLADREAFHQHALRSAAVVPVALAGGTAGIRGALALGSTTMEYDWAPAIIEELRLVAGIFGQALARKATLTALECALEELDRLRERSTNDETQRRPDTRLRPSGVRDRLRAENLYLRHEARERFGAGLIVGQSPAIRRVMEQAAQVAATDSTVLLLGETGTGKELIAAHVHEQSGRRGRVMVRVNCASIPATLMESELFGREKGAFTGAIARQIGRFELANHSTIFLDEIGDLPTDVQVKLLRVLEERQIERLGSPTAIRVNVRIIAATHRNLAQRIADESFREDLFYRLNVFPIQVPPLRDRTEDIPLLVWRFVDEFSKSFGKRIDSIPRDNMVALQQYTWPGNIRELRNVVERAMIVATPPQLTIALPTPSDCPDKRSVRMTDVEREHIHSVLERCRWRIRGSGGAAERLGLRPTTLETRMHRLGLSRPSAV
jgi:PAS domain S-box-containing protein